MSLTKLVDENDYSTQEIWTEKADFKHKQKHLSQHGDKARDFVLFNNEYGERFHYEKDSDVFVTLIKMENPVRLPGDVKDYSAAQAENEAELARIAADPANELHEKVHGGVVQDDNELIQGEVSKEELMARLGLTQEQFDEMAKKNTETLIKCGWLNPDGSLNEENARKRDEWNAKREAAGIDADVDAPLDFPDVVTVPMDFSADETVPPEISL